MGLDRNSMQKKKGVKRMSSADYTTSVGTRTETIHIHYIHYIHYITFHTSNKPEAGWVSMAVQEGRCW